jgi:hypothetical protein
VNSQVQHGDSIESLVRAADLSDGSGHHTYKPLSSSLNDSVHALSLVRPPTPGYWPSVGVQEACLMHYFIDNLACWVSNHLKHIDNAGLTLYFHNRSSISVIQTIISPS